VLAISLIEFGIVKLLDTANEKIAEVEVGASLFLNMRVPAPLM